MTPEEYHASADWSKGLVTVLDEAPTLAAFFYIWDRTSAETRSYQEMQAAQARAKDRFHPERATATPEPAAAQSGWVAVGEPEVHYKVQYHSIGNTEWYDVPGASFLSHEAAVKDLEKTKGAPEVSDLFELRVIRITVAKEVPTHAAQ